MYQYNLILPLLTASIKIITFIEAILFNIIVQYINDIILPHYGF